MPSSSAWSMVSLGSTTKRRGRCEACNIERIERLDRRSGPDAMPTPMSGVDEQICVDRIARIVDVRMGFLMSTGEEGRSLAPRDRPKR